MMFGLRRITSRASVTSTSSLMKSVKSCSMSSSAILFHDVAASMDGVKVASKISFKLEKGDRVALTGSNQEGRNGIMKLLSGELAPDSGHINFLQGKSVVKFNPSVGKKDKVLSVESFLAQHSIKPEAIKEALNVVALGDLRLARSLSSLPPSNIFRLQLLLLQFTRPDVLLIDFSFDSLSYEDVELLTSYLKSNPMGSTIVMNLNDEHFVQQIANNIIEVESVDLPVTQSYDNLASVQTKTQLKRKQVAEATAAAIRDEIKRKAEHDSNPATIEALNAIGLQNATQAVSQEEYIRVMVLFMILHPPIAIALYCGGFFDAIF